MKLNKKLQNIGFAIIAGIALICFIVGWALDQKIAGKVGDFDNLFGILLTAFGVMGTLTIGSIAGAILFFMPKHENKKVDIGLRILGAISFVVFVFFETKEAVEYADFPRMAENETTYKVLMIAFLAIKDLAIILLTKLFIKKVNPKTLVPACILIIAVIVFYAASCEFVKYLASRPRPRVVEQGIEFRQWYQFQPLRALKNEYHDCKSFVSGHACNSACIISVLPLLLTLRRKEIEPEVQIIALTVGALYTFVVAFSRMVAKAHYMTDVMGGIMLSVAMQALIINFTPKIFKKLQ